MNAKDSPTFYGGQAVIEGVMMRGKKAYTLAVRHMTTKLIETKNYDIPESNRLALFKLPIFRGMAAFVQSMVIGMKVITVSAEMAGFDDLDEEMTPFEKKLSDMFGPKLNDVLIGFSVVVAIALSIGLFMVLPVIITSFFRNYLEPGVIISTIEGLVKIGIFTAYVLLISRMKDVRRVFEYHGAEHKTINCYEEGEELILQNVKKCSKIHKRCGTSFLVFVLLISIFVFMFLRTTDPVLRIISRIVLVPFIAGISYEVIKWAGRSKSRAVAVVSYPGMCFQLLTTKEPDDSQIEVAITALKGVLDAEEQNEHKASS
jgi:uncharacterized protein YqhQ